MSSVPVPVPPNLLPLVDLLTTLANTEPVVADHIAPVIVNMFEFAMASGKVTDPKVWVRALEGAVAFIETNHLDDEWLSRTVVK